MVSTGEAASVPALALTEQAPVASIAGGSSAQKRMRRPAATQPLPLGEGNPARRVANAQRPVVAAPAERLDFRAKIHPRQPLLKQVSGEPIEFAIQLTALLEFHQRPFGNFVESRPLGVDLRRDVDSHRTSKAIREQRIELVEALSQANGGELRQIAFRALQHLAGALSNRDLRERPGETPHHAVVRLGETQRLYPLQDRGSSRQVAVRA